MSPSRRSVLRAGALTLFAGTSGCLGDDGSGRPEFDRLQWFHPVDSLVGQLRVTDEHLLALTYRRLLVLDRDGAVTWSEKLDEQDDTVEYDAGLAVHDGHVYVSGAPGTRAYAIDGTTGWRNDDVASFGRITGSDSGLMLPNRGGVTALDPATGDRRWEAFEETDENPTPVSVTDDAVYVGIDDGRCARLSPRDGAVKWTHRIGSPRSAVPVERDGVVYVGGDVPGGTSGVLAALSPEDGSERWRVETGPVIFDSEPTIDGEAVYVGTGNGTVHAHARRSGEERWTFEPESEDDLLFAPPAVGTAVYAKDNRGTLYALDRDDGEERWRVEVGGGLNRPKLLDGTLYVGSHDGIVAIATG